MGLVADHLLRELISSSLPQIGRIRNYEVKPVLGRAEVVDAVSPNELDAVQRQLIEYAIFLAGSDAPGVDVDSHPCGSEFLGQADCNNPAPAAQVQKSRWL